MERLSVVFVVTLALLAAPLLLHGCGAMPIGGDTLEVSQPTLAVSEGWRVRGSHRLEGPGISLVVVPQNARRGLRWVLPVMFPVVLPPHPVWDDPPIVPPKPFRIELTFYPEADGFTFDPGRVVLTTHDRKMLDHVTECGGSRAVERPVRISNGLCLLLFFAVDPPPPSVEFSVLLDGLERDGIAIPVPLVYFRRA